MEERIKKIFKEYRKAVMDEEGKDKWDSFDWESAVNFLLGDLERDILKVVAKIEKKSFRKK